MERVIVIPELLEAILFEVPFEDLLIRIPLVCHAWKEAIEQSVIIQQKLFFTGKPSKTVEFPEQNPILRRKFWPFFRGTWWGSKIEDYDYTVFRKMEWNKNRKSRRAYAREDASWRRMLPCQPPLFTLHLERIKDSGDSIQDVEFRFGFVFFDGALTMATLYDAVFEQLEFSNVLFEVDCELDVTDVHGPILLWLKFYDNSLEDDSNGRRRRYLKPGFRSNGFKKTEFFLSGHSEFGSESESDDLASSAEGEDVVMGNSVG